MLLRDGGGLVDIRYSASCGGHSEDNDAIWGGDPDPSLRGRRDDPKAQRLARHRRNLGAFLDEDPKTRWCGRASKLGKGRFRWTETITRRRSHRAHRRRLSRDRSRQGADRRSSAACRAASAR